MRQTGFLLWFLLWVCFGYGQGHVYPVLGTVHVVPPYSFYLSDYVSGSRERFSVTLLNRDARYPGMSVKLRLSIQGSGFSLQTRPYASVKPLILEPNVPYHLTPEDLQPYFDVRNLSFQGLAGGSFQKEGKLPEGMIEFGVEVLEYGTSKVLSRKAVGTAWLVLQKPPQLSLPFHEEVIPWREPQNLLFQWTPQYSGVARVEYELVIKELWDNGLAVESAFAYSPEIFRERVSSTTYLYGALAPSLEPGRRYAWAVRVVAKEGADDVKVFENDGLSVIRSFRLSRPCPEVSQIKAIADRGSISLSWEGVPEHSDYLVAYRLKGAEEWSEVRSSLPTARLTGLRGGNTYEYRVAGYCEPHVATFAPMSSFTLPTEDTARLRNCGIQPTLDLSNQVPLESLSSGDVFMAGDFPVHVQEASGSAGMFSGVGYVNVPFLGFAPFRVRFDHIFINTDGRMVRGEVNTLYDPSESGLTNLDDIFTGGGTTGKVVEGITKTDLRADFVITESSDFFFDETQNEIEVHDENGQVIGYIETGNVLSESKSPEGGTGNEPSVFPMTLEDKEGNLYQVEEIPGAGGSDDLPEDSDGVRKKLSVKPLGKAGGALRGDEVNFKRLDREVAEVVFSDVDGSLYAFDGWESCYDKSYLIRDKYEQLGQDYYVPSKLLPSGKSDKVLAILKIQDGSSLDPERVLFKTSSGTEYRPDSYDAKTRRWVLSLVGGQENDGQELYALYPKPGGGYYNLGKLLIVSYPSYRLPVKIVPVGKDFLEYDLLERRLREIYARVGIECLVEKLPVFAYDSPLFFKDQSGLLSAYNSEMKSLNSAYASSHVVEEDASYLFILSQSGHKRDRNFSGFMPLGKQYGYLFRDDFKNFDAFSVAAAHELAHGRLSLRHPFDKSLGLSEGDVPDNLMDYRNGTHLAKWQWDVIHDPGVVVRLFERDEDGAIQQNNSNYFAQKFLNPLGKLDRTHEDAFLIQDQNDYTIAFILPDESVFEWKHTKSIQGYFKNGGTSYKASYTGYVEDKYNRENEPLSWGIYLAACDIGDFFIHLGGEPIETTEGLFKGFWKIVSLDFDIEKTWNRILAADKTDASYLISMVCLSYLAGPKGKQLILSEDYNKFAEIAEECAITSRKVSWSELLELFKRAKNFESRVTEHLKILYPIEEGYVHIRQLYLKVDGVTSIADNIIFNPKTGQFILNETKYGTTNTLTKNQNILNKAIREGKKIEIRSQEGIIINNNVIYRQGDRILINKILRSNSVNGIIDNTTIKSIWP